MSIDNSVGRYCNWRALNITITTFTNNRGAIIQVVIQHTPSRLPGWTNTSGRVLVTTYTLLLYSPVSVCFTSCDSHISNHTTMGTLQIN